MLERKTIEFIKGFLEAEFEDFNSNELTSLKEQVVKFGFESFNNEAGFYNLKRHFKDVLDMEHVTLKVDETTNKVLKCDAYDSLVELYPELVDIINSCFKDDYMDNIHIEEGISITFNTWEAGAPASFTYNFNGKLISYYNAELGEEISYEDETEVYFDDENMEDETMKNINEETAATTEEKQDAVKKAEDFVETAKEKMIELGKKTAPKMKSFLALLKKLNEMPSDEAEKFLSENGVELLTNTKEKAMKLIKNIDISSELDNGDKEVQRKRLRDRKTFSELVETINATLGDEEKTAWGKFKDIVKEIASYILRFFLKGIAIGLKVAFTLGVGCVKIGATALFTTGKAIGVLNKEVLKPALKAGKTAWNTYKANKVEKAKATIKEAEEEEFAEVREALFGVDENEEDAE